MLSPTESTPGGGRRLAIVLGVLALVLAGVLLFALRPKPKRAGADRVLVVVLDGVSSAVVQHLGATQLPVLHGLAARGAYTWNARSEPDSTETLPNHVSMLTGRTVAEHGYTDNTIDGRVPAAPGVDSIFDAASRAGLDSAFVGAKAKLRLLSARWKPGFVSLVDRNDFDTLGALEKLLTKRQPELIVLHFAEADAAGHAYGWESAPYRTAVAKMDAFLGRAVARVEALGGRTAIIVTADHGGHGDNHVDPDDPIDFTIPLVVVGGPRTGELYTLNAGRRADPGRAKTSTTVGLPPIGNREVAKLALDLLGLGGGDLAL